MRATLAFAAPLAQIQASDLGDCAGQCTEFQGMYNDCMNTTDSVTTACAAHCVKLDEVKTCITCANSTTFSGQGDVIFAQLQELCDAVGSAGAAAGANGTTSTNSTASANGTASANATAADAATSEIPLTGAGEISGESGGEASANGDAAPQVTVTAADSSGTDAAEAAASSGSAKTLGVSAAVVLASLVVLL